MSGVLRMNDLLKDVKFNCDASDAGYWGYFSICGLLMRYRDLFRSEKGLDPWRPIAREEIAAWIGEKESRWADLEGRDLRDLTIMGATYSPFDVAGINLAIGGAGLVYGAGYGMYLKPTFFLARVRSIAEVEGHTVHITERELVRDLFTALAMLQGRSIFLRLEPLKALLWDKFTELKPDRAPALSNAFQAYGITPGQSIGDGFARQLEHMALAYSAVLLRHELAESKEAAPQWKELLMQAGDRNTEHFLRAVQDLVADTSETGPFRSIIEKQDPGALGLSIGLLDGYRRLLFPEIREAYGRFLKDGAWEAVENARRNGHARFLAIRRTVLELFIGGDQDSFRRGIGEMMHELDQAAFRAPAIPMAITLSTNTTSENYGA
jgi:hypothetical protein